MTLTSKLSKPISKMILWILLAVGLISLGFILLNIFQSNNSASFSLQPPSGTCYRFDPNVGLPPVNNITYSECQTNYPHWFEFCFTRQPFQDPGCFLREIQERQGQTGPDYDNIADNTTGWCQLEHPGKVIKDITYAACRQKPNWVSFAYGGQAVAHRRGPTTIEYKKGSAVLHDKSSDCVLNENKIKPPVCTNAIEWCAYDNPSFCIKSSDYNPS